MSFEVELKFRVDEIAILIRSLTELGLGRIREKRQSDEYYRHPARDFAETDEAFRIRRDDESACLTYKGPKIDPDSKTRREIEVRLAGLSEIDEMREMLSALGFSRSGVVDKRRSEGELEWKGRTIVVAIDDVERLGEFVEFEVVVELEEQIAQARNELLELAEHLGLSKSDRRGYIQMLHALPKRDSDHDG